MGCHDAGPAWSRLLIDLRHGSRASLGIFVFRGVAQLVARLVWDQEVESSNLSAPTVRLFSSLFCLEKSVVFQRLLAVRQGGQCQAAKTCRSMR